MLEVLKIQSATYRITDDCVGCGLCRKRCPWDAIIGGKNEQHIIEPMVCQHCSTCWQICPKRAVEDAEGFRREGKARGKAPRSRIEGDACAGCQNCYLACEQRAIVFRPGFPTGRSEVNVDRCNGCGACHALCPSSCIEFGFDNVEEQ